LLWPNTLRVLHPLNKTLLITGASSGVGLSLARYLANHYQVVAVARRVERMQEALSDRPQVVVRQADLGAPEDVEQLVDWLKSRFGHVPYVVNNAGVNIRGSVGELSPGDVSRSIAVNMLAPFAILRGLLPGMKANNFGRVINVTSGAPLNCFPGFSAYSASKAALNALTVTCARECLALNIRINLMSPGPVRTEMAPNASMDPSACHPTVDYLLNLEEGGPTGRFFWLGYEIPLFPNLEGIDWMGGKADARFARVVEEN
jgi:NAD(P)-dependent dehydrogenase (short-subunit alcohol dehydrogenase family)